jgi:uncharacterized protein (TIGR02996 family)
MAKTIEVRLHDEGLVIEGTLSQGNDRTWFSNSPCAETLEWRCLCGTEIDTARMSRREFYTDTGRVHDVIRGYFLRCSGCGRWYMHHLALGYVEGRQQPESIPDRLRQRMPGEAGFLDAVLAAPDDIALRLIYADFLEERGDARAEALRLKCSIATIPEGDPRRAELAARLEQLRPTLDPGWFALVVRLGPAALCLIGSPEHDLAELPQRVSGLGMNVRPPGVVQTGDYVVFCISCPDGPTPGTREAVRRCAGRTVAPVALVLTRAEALDDDSLRDLVTLEEMELLSHVIPREEVERLPLYYDFDPGLTSKLLARVSEGPRMISCSRSEAFGE